MLIIEKSNHPEALGAFRNNLQAVLEVFAHISPRHIHSSKGPGFVGLAQEPGRPSPASWRKHRLHTLELRDIGDSLVQPLSYHAHLHFLSVTS